MNPTGTTKEATGHSPLPWKAYPDDSTDRWYVAQDGGDTPAYGTSVTGWGCVQQSKADAELIVTAVNERERLREALELCLLDSETAALSGNPIAAERVRIARAALNEADGVEG